MVTLTCNLRVICTVFIWTLQTDLNTYTCESSIVNLTTKTAFKVHSIMVWFWRWLVSALNYPIPIFISHTQTHTPTPTHRHIPFILHLRNHWSNRAEILYAHRIWGGNHNTSLHQVDRKTSWLCKWRSKFKYPFVLYFKNQYSDWVEIWCAYTMWLADHITK